VSKLHYEGDFKNEQRIEKTLLFHVIERLIAFHSVIPQVRLLLPTSYLGSLEAWELRTVGNHSNAPGATSGL
jgi:hypothetical protein